MKIAGYILEFYIDQGDAWVNAVDPKTTGPITVHRQCAWNHDMLGTDEEITMEKIPVEQADKYTCQLCGLKLSEQVYFAFQAERIA